MLGSALELKWNRKDLESLRTVVERYVPKDKRRVAVQAGGCLGVFADYLSSRFGAVYTFEPDTVMFRKMVTNIADCLNVVPMQAALGNERRMIHTVCDLRNNDKTVLHEGMTRTEPGGHIPTLRIDDLGLPYCDLIYLDIEGDEYAALLGALTTLTDHKPVVVCEINRGIDYRGISREAIPVHLARFGYTQVEKLRSDYVFVCKEAKDV